MEVQQLRSMVSDGKIFGVKFIKRTDGRLRVMAARVGVIPKVVSNQPRTWDPESKGLLQVWDLHKRGYRMIPADSIQEVTVRGQRITF